MFRIRPAAALLALSLIAMAGPVMAAPAVSTAVAFSLSNPVGNPVKGPDGALYGTATPITSVAGGVIWRAAVDGSEVRTLYQLTPDDAVAPGSGLTVGSDGLLYGTTKFGRGSDVTGAGSIFKIAPNGTGFAIIFRFAPITSTNAELSPINTNGAYPEAELIEGHDGMLYGAARTGGTNGTGTLFRIARDGTGFQVLHTFAANTSAANSGLTVTVDGAAPTGQLVQDADGVLYGTASSGGNNGRGTVFRINADGTGFQVLHHFSAAVFTDGVAKNDDGMLPLGGLVDGNDGFLYGMASQAGRNGFGVIYAIKPDGSGFNALHTFSNTDGARPLAELQPWDRRQAVRHDIRRRRQLGHHRERTGHVLCHRPHRDQLYEAARFRERKRHGSFEQGHRASPGRVPRAHQQRGQLRLRHDLALQRRGRHGHRQHALRPEEEQQQRWRQRRIRRAPAARRSGPAQATPGLTLCNATRTTG